MSGPEIVTFGCRLNAYESEVIRSRAAEAGDAVIFNTCAVTGEAVRQARQAIRKARRLNPGARIIVTGCAAQIDPASFAAMPEVDQVLGNAEKMETLSYGADGPRIHVTEASRMRETAGHLVGGPARVGAHQTFGGRARAFIQVQNGCDHRCTFCIIPLGRGPSRSVPIGAIVEEVRALVEAGTAEVVLTGVDLTAYGGDLPGRPTLGQMARRLLAQVPALQRLRLSSLDPVEIDDDLFRLVETEERLLPHLHLSLQAGDDLILKRMKRRHSRADAVALARRLRTLRPDIVLGADFIAGFPTEDEAMFRATLDLVAECGLTFLHVFPYSAREGTPAAKMPPVPGPVRRERAARLRAAGEAALAAYFAGRVGAGAQVLVEQDGLGHSEHFAPVRLAGAAPAGTIVPVRITGFDATHLHGIAA